MSSSAKDLETMLRDLDTVSREIGLTMNTSKTKTMTNANLIPIHIREQIEFVTDYIYLGQNLSFQNLAEKEMKIRIAQAWKKFWRLKHILMDKHQRMSLKAGIAAKLDHYHTD